MKKKTYKIKNGFIRTGITNLVGIGLIGASAGAVNALPVGTARTVAGIVPGLQSAALVGQNLKFIKRKKSK